ncbi:MAG: hypothetical protein ACYDG2_05305 [Ruminiclostridium sp.]
MLRKLFLSIIILSTLASEGGASYSADLIDFYLVNLAHLGIIQDSRIDISRFDVQKLNSLDRKGTPVAFYKLVSQDSFNSKASNKHNHLEFLWIYGLTLVLAIFIVLFISLNNKIFFITRRALLSLTDSSPPAYC